MTTYTWRSTGVPGNAEEHEVTPQGPQGIPGPAGPQGPAGVGIASSALAARPAPAAAPHSLHSVTDAVDLAVAAKRPDSRLTYSDGTARRRVPFEFNVLDYLDMYGGDANGGANCSAAFRACVDAAVDAYYAGGGGSLARGARIKVPAGKYRLDSDLELIGRVTLEGEGPGATELRFGVGKGVVLHSQGSAYRYVGSGAARIKGVFLYGTRPTFKTWTAATAYQVGDCVRGAKGSHVGYWECVQAGTSGAGPAREVLQPCYIRPWTPNTSFGYRSAVFATGRWDVIFANMATGGTTGATEPNWTSSPTHVVDPLGGFGTLGALTADGTCSWEANAMADHNSAWFDGSVVWLARCHTAVQVLCLGGRVEDFVAYEWANYGVTSITSVFALPWSNSNNFRVTDGQVQSCGGGVYCAGGDSNGGYIENVIAITIGYEVNQTTPIPYDAAPAQTGLPTAPQAGSGGHGFHDNSFLGCTWIANTAEQCVGRGHYASNSAGWATMLGMYTEGNCAPNKFGANCVALGGIQAAGVDLASGGIHLFPNQVSGLRLRMHPDHADAPYGNACAGGTFPGVYCFGDAVQAQSNYFAWHKGWNGVEADVWTFGLYPYGSRAFFGVAGWDHAAGAHWRDFEGHFYGPSGADAFVCHLPTATLAAAPQRVRLGQRVVGDRFEPPGGFVVGADRYVGKMCTTAGWEGVAAWAAATTYYGANTVGGSVGSLGIAAATIAPGNGHVYQCQETGASSGAEPNWASAMTLNATCDDGGGQTWKNVGPVAVFKHYGLCV